MLPEDLATWEPGCFNPVSSETSSGLWDQWKTFGVQET